MAPYSEERKAQKRARCANPETWPFIALATIKHRAARAGITCTISAADIKVPPGCPVLGIPLVPGGARHSKPNSPSVDRFDNSIGYVPGNVRVISHRANQLKADATVKELVSVLEYMLGRR